MSGKLCMITGASTGMGKVTAVALAQRGFELTLVCRDPVRAEAAVAEIRGKTPDAKVEVMLADLSSQESIRKLAADFKARHRRLDVLVNNAGAILMERRTTVDGIETTFATNHLGYFLLTNLLLEVLKASAPARIVNVSSAGHKGGKLDFDDLNRDKSYSGFRAYCDSKLANLYFTYELARRLEGTGVTVNSLHPGAVASNFGQGDGTRWFRVIMKLGKPFLRSVEKGAETSIYLASSPEVEGVSGKYFIDCAPRHSSRRSQDPEIAQRLWQVSAQLTGLSAST